MLVEGKRLLNAYYCCCLPDILFLRVLARTGWRQRGATSMPAVRSNLRCTILGEYVYVYSSEHRQKQQQHTSLGILVCTYSYFCIFVFFFANLLHEKTPTTEGPAEVTAAAAEAASGSERKQHHQQQQAAAATAASAAASTAVAADEAEDAKAEPTSELPLYLWVDIPHISASSRSYHLLLRKIYYKVFEN